MQKLSPLNASHKERFAADIRKSLAVGAARSGVPISSMGSGGGNDLVERLLRQTDSVSMFASFSLCAESEFAKRPGQSGWHCQCQPSSKPQAISTSLHMRGTSSQNWNIAGLQASLNEIASDDAVKVHHAEQKPQESYSGPKQNISSPSCVSACRVRPPKACLSHAEGPHIANGCALRISAMCMTACHHCQ